MTRKRSSFIADAEQKRKQFGRISHFSIRMNDHTTFSRAYLQRVPEEKKQNLINQIINTFHCHLIQTAQTGKTSYMVDERTRNMFTNQRCFPPHPVFTDEEFIRAIEKKYPDCKVTYEDIWVDNGVNNRTLKKGIVIDWS